MEERGKPKKYKRLEAAAPLEERGTPQGKEKRRSEEGGNDKAEKSGMVKRSWNLNDEIAFLSGIADCRGTMLPKSSLFSYVKNKYLDGEYTDTQLNNKMKKLKLKFKNMEKNEQSGYRFNSPHDEAKFELSKTIWGRDRKENTTARRNANEDVNENTSKKLRDEKDEDEEEEVQGKDEYQTGAFKEVGDEAEEKKLKRKLLKQEARKIEAYIETLALKQQKLQRKLEKLRAPENT